MARIRKIRKKYDNANNKDRQTRDLQPSIQGAGLKSQKQPDRYRKSGELKRLNKLDAESHKKSHSPMKFLPFENAKEIVQKYKLKSWEEWNQFCKSGKLPDNIPHNPEKTYKKEWNNKGDWVGTTVTADQGYRRSTWLPKYIPQDPAKRGRRETSSRKSHQNKKFRSIKGAREFVHRLRLKNQPEWKRYLKSNHPDRSNKDF